MKCAFAPLVVLGVLLASVVQAQTPPPNVGPQGTIGPAGSNSVSCDSDANCCVCATAGNCVAGAGGTCNHTGVGWESAIEGSHAGHTGTTESILLQGGNYNTAQVTIPTGASGTVRFKLRNYLGATNVNVDANIRFTKPGHVDVEGITFQSDNNSSVIYMASTNATKFEDIHFDWIQCLDGGSKGVHIVGNVDDVTFDDSFFNCGRGTGGSTIKIQCYDEERPSEGDAPDGEPAACEYAPTNIKVRHSKILHNLALHTDDDNIQFEGYGDGCELSHSVLQENANEDCIDVKGQGTVGAVLTIANNIVHGNSPGGSAPDDDDGCVLEAVQIQGNRARRQDLIIEGNWINGDVTHDGSSSGIFRNNAFTALAGAPASSPRMRHHNMFDTDFFNNTMDGGTFDIGNGPDDRECPRVTVDNNIFDGTDNSGWEKTTTCESRCVGGIWDGTTDNDCTCSISGTPCHRHGDLCPSGQKCDCTGNEFCTADTDCDGDLGGADTLCTFYDCTANGTCEQAWPNVPNARNNVSFNITGTSFIDTCDAGSDNEGGVCKGDGAACFGTPGTCSDNDVATETTNPNLLSNRWELPGGSSSAKGNALVASTPVLDIEEVARGSSPFDIGAHEESPSGTTTTTTTLTDNCNGATWTSTTVSDRCSGFSSTTTTTLTGRCQIIGPGTDALDWTGSTALEGMWPFEGETSPGGNALDAGPVGNDLTDSHSELVRIDSSAIIDEHVAITTGMTATRRLLCSNATCPSLAVTGSATWGGWFYSGMDSGLTMMSRLNFGTGGYQLSRGTGFELQCSISGSGGPLDIITSNGDVAPSSTWIHLVCRFDDSADDFDAIAGSIVVATSAPVFSMTTSTRDFDLPDTAANGTLVWRADEVFVHDEALTDQQICRVGSCGWDGSLCTCVTGGETAYLDCERDEDCHTSTNTNAVCRGGLCTGYNVGPIPTMNGCTLPVCNAAAP